MVLLAKSLLLSFGIVGALAGFSLNGDRTRFSSGETQMTEQTTSLKKQYMGKCGARRLTGVETQTHLLEEKDVETQTRRLTGVETQTHLLEEEDVETQTRQRR